jgi:molybdopterin converting factor subunit 1
MHIELRYFAAARERVGLQSESLLVEDGLTVDGALVVLAALHPALAPLLPRLRVAVNQEFADGTAVIPPGAEVALIPPVAGGSDGGQAIQLLATPLSLDAVVRLVSGPGFGAVVTFTGAVRDHSRGVSVSELTYEAYGPMALRTLARIAAAAEEKFTARGAIHHRVGTLQVGELAVVIAAAAAHRAEAFEACRHAIEELKRDVPIWKKELSADGAVWVGLGP